MRPDLRLPRLSLLGALALTLGVAGSASAQTVRIQPSLDTRLTWTDNVDTSATDEQQDWIAEISPGVSISRESGRVSGGLDMRLRNTAHVERTEDNATYLALQGRGTIEAIEDAFFVDLAASISRDNLSAFGGRVGGDTLDTDEDNETRLFSIAPRFAFRFGASGQGNIGYQQRWRTGGDSTTEDERSGTWNFGLADPTALRLFGWGLDYQRTDTRYDGGDTQSASQDVTQEVGRGTLFINLDPQFRVRAIGGYESNDYGLGQGDEGAIWGAGFDWFPTDRSAISVTGEDRVFGTGYDVSFEHRMARSVWSLSATRDITSSLDELGERYLRTPQNFEDLADLLQNDPDAVQDYLAGLTPTNIRSNRYFLSKALRAGVSLIGVRNTVSLSLSQTDRSQLEGITYTGLDNDELDDYERVKTRAFSLSLDHKLSGLASLRLAALRSKSEGEGVEDDETTRTAYTVSLTRRLGAQASGSLTYRHIKSEGDDSYTENAVTAVLGMRF